MDDDRTLIELADVVRRTLSSRTRDSNLIEDITQETLLRVAVLRPQLNPDVQRAYAIVTARNGFLNHCRSQDVARRHAHRVVEFTSFDGPEQVTLERDETDALAVALDALDPADRQLLLDHEVGDRPLSGLADELHTSSGAVAMRLARARATLRLEFVLAFRRVTLPTDRCRPVLLALSAGDGRRQSAVDAPGHLLECDECAALLEPVAHRRRGAAAWLFIPFGAAGRALARAGRALRHSPKVQAASVAVAAVAAAAVIVVATASTSQGAATTTATPARAAAAPVTPAAPTPTTAVAATVTTAPASTAPAPSSPPAAVTAGAVPATTGCAPESPVSPSPTDAGCTYDFADLRVTAVPANEGFWAAGADGAPLWVQLVGRGESPEVITTSQIVNVHATIVGVDPAVTAGLSAETVAHMQQRGVYLAVAYANLKIDTK